jgi:protein phosphatase
MPVRLMSYYTSAYSASDIGLVRQNNEDASKLLKQEQFFVLADGMGGHQAGEIASKLTVKQLCHLFQQRSDEFNQDISTAKKVLREIIQEVNEAIFRLSKESPHLRGMGTTLCCLFFHPEGLIYGHVGDSRIYLLRCHQLKQLTQDHSLLRELIELGQLSQQQAGDFLYKNIITKAIGTELSVEPAVAQLPVEVDDLFLMCTDGLTDLVSVDEIETIIDQNSATAAVDLLVKKAKQNGGYDNITVILVKVYTLEAGMYGSHLSGS